MIQRKHLVTYHGVLAPASGLRPQVVPRRVEEEGEAGGCQHGATGGAAGAESAEGVAAAGDDGVENVAVAALLRQQAERRVRARLRVPLRGGRRRSGRRWYSWAELLQRTLPRQSFSGLLRRPCRQRTRRRAAHVAKTVLQRPPAEAWSAEDSVTCSARTGSRCGCARRARESGGCWRRSTTRRRSRGCFWRWGCLRLRRSRRAAGRRQQGAGSTTPARAPRSDGGRGAVTEGRSRRGSSLFVVRQTGRNDAGTG